MNNGYWSFDRSIPPQYMEEFLRHISEHKGEIVVREGIEFHPFEPATTPDALCRYCWSPNLHTSTHCEKCGGPMVH